ncbi:MAG: TRAP transporter TatT component family protein [Thermodesulfobacteriota bacterium]
MIGDGAVSLFKELALSVNRQSDTHLVRQGLPSYLMLTDSLVQSLPENPDLLLAAAQAYGAYASSLGDEEADRSARLIQRAKSYALRALDLHPLFKGAEKSSFERFQLQMGQAGKDQVPLLFNVGSLWGSWIAQGPDAIEGMADLPKVEILMNRVLELDPGYYYGGPHLFKAILLSARPVPYGGDLTKAEYHFQQALKYSQGRFLMTQVYYAQYYAKQKLDRDLFSSILNQVLATPADKEPDLILLNTLAQEKAKKLLEQADEFF